MAYQAGASLGKFWDAILELRSQRLKEQIAEGELRDKMQSRAMEMSQSIGNSILGGMKQSKSDAMYNQMSQEVAGMGGVPRAGAVNVPWSDKEMQGKAFTGGKEEYGARMEMAQMGQKMLQQQNANQAAKQLTTIRDQQIAKNKFDSASKPFTSAFRDMDAYLDSQKVDAEGLQAAIEAGNRPVYEQGVRRQTALYKAYKEAHPNSDVPPPVTPPFVKASEMKAISDAQQGITSQQSALGGMKESAPWLSPSVIPSFIPKEDTLRSFGSNKDQIEQLKKDIQSEQQKLREMPGSAEVLKFQQKNLGAATGDKAGQIVGGWALGKRKVNKQTGQAVVWNGTEWVME